MNTSKLLASFLSQQRTVSQTLRTTILLVEDNLDNQILIRDAINKANLAVCVQLVENTEEAMRYLQGRDAYGDRDRYPLPALILTTVDMPYLLGLEFLVWVKQQPELMHLSIVTLSSSAKMEQPLNLDSGFYFVKTPPFDRLIDIVRLLVP
jgi:CheY-like chemotaxis protein